MNLASLFSEGLSHHMEGRVDQAKRIYLEILKKDPGHADALHHLGLVHLQSGLISQAINEIQSSLVSDPRNSNALANLSYCFNLIGDHIEASASCNAALEIDPDNDGAWTNLGNAQRELEFFAEALCSYDRALCLCPGNPRYIYNVGLALFDQGDFDRAKEYFQKCLAIDPSIPEAHNNLGACSLKLHDPLVALNHANRAIELNPDYAEAWSNRGNAFNDLKRHDEALASHERSIELNPDYAEAWSNRGNAFNDLRRHEEALASYDRSIELKPDYAKAHWNKSLVLLRCGFFEEGWKLYEWRWQLDSSTSLRRDFIQPLWRGEQPIAGRTILLHAEQGLGDTIQFYRYVKLVALRGAKVIVEVQKPLVGIFKTLGGSITVVAKGDVLPKFDYHCPLLSLPLAFKTDLNSISADIPYLCPDNKKLQEWSIKVGLKKQIRIGIVWGGSREHKNDKNRSICALAMSKLLTDNFEWFSLQKEYRDGDRQMLERSKVYDYSNVLLDFSDTAALLSQLDLVISVDTSVAHLAGAMGKPTWVMLPYIPDFRWLWDREDSPWYPSMRLFRQPAPGDWSPVIYNVSSALRARYIGIC